MSNESNAEIDDVVLELEDETVEPEQEIDWKATAMRYKKKLKEAKTPSAPARNNDDSDVRSQLARLELKTEGYSEDAIAFIQKNGGRDALNDPYVTAAVKAIQEQKSAEQAIVANETTKSDIERKFTPEEINAMSPEEMYKVLPKAKK